MAQEYSRRQFFRLFPYRAVEASTEGNRDNDQLMHYFRPPGALTEKEFLQTCERCQKCSEACPYDVIKHLDISAGIAENTPFLEPHETPCRWCLDLDCIKACPSSALSIQENGNINPIGKAEIDLSTCYTGQGILCDLCQMSCPSTIKAITMVKKKPVINNELCVGCGLCAYYCDSIPVSIKLNYS